MTFITTVSAQSTVCLFTTPVNEKSMSITEIESVYCKAISEVDMIESSILQIQKSLSPRNGWNYDVPAESFNKMLTLHEIKERCGRLASRLAAIAEKESNGRVSSKTMSNTCQVNNGK